MYAPTKAAIEVFVPRMPRGAVIAFDEVGIKRLRFERLPFDPYIGHAILSRGGQGAGSTGSRS